MKISEVTVQDLVIYLREDNNDVSTLSTFNMMVSAAKSYIKFYTGLTDEQMDEKEDLTIALFVLVSYMYDTRTYTVQNDKVNKVVSSILNMHSQNLL
ncbi:head-tail connector protein [Lysinibacillus sphaericus]|uniref:Phage protein n=1 Tax=Lysinibacillus sphaericus OT4b.31 TaxID=1285586 RepID=R7Z8J5_LYSSH|nr:head-tail connector protein [Lysinibacillus sphaericus]EON70462.1 hypothetical protein H131_21297 [Lysinibacillus sphaericus OT4b.31]